MDKNELRNYRALAAEVRQLQDHLQTLEQSLSCPNRQRFTRTPSGVNDGDKTTEALVEAHQDLVRLYQKKLLQLDRELRRIEDAIGQVKDPQERLLLRYRYIEGHDWNKVAQEMHYSYTQTLRIHGLALQHLPQSKVNPFGWDKDYSGLTE